MRRAKILLADDHAIVAEGLGRLLADHFDLVGIATSGQRLLEAAREHRPDVIVTDLSMPVIGGLEALRRLKGEGLDVRVIFLTMHSDPQLALEAVRQGAAGYLVKDSASDELVTAINEVLQGRVYLTPMVTRGVIDRMSGDAEKSLEALSPRQREVLAHIVQGKRMKEIAAVLNLSTRTVETYKYEMMETLGVKSTAELVKYALQHGLAYD